MLYVLNLTALLLFAALLWSSTLRTRNVNVVDVGWGLGFVLVAWLTWIFSRVFHRETVPEFGSMAYSSLLLGMVSLWGLRLSGYLAWRSWGKAEDYRYAAMREHWGNRFQLRSLFTVFSLQAVLIWFISLSLQMGIPGSSSSGVVLAIGVLMWAIGWLFEAVGDWQLLRFKADMKNKGKVMNRGLWRWTRHPNYFGDFLVWWGIYLVAAQPDSWWWTISGPALMSFLLLRVSGVSLLESSLKDRLEGYREYVQGTSSFFPWPPKKL